MPDNGLDHQVVAGRYELIEPVGRGGFGVVWRARDSLLQRQVAVKEIQMPGFLGDSERAQLGDKVLREARAAARLDHPGAVTVYDVIDEGGRPVIVMELVAAPDLAHIVAERGPIAPVEAARIGVSVLDVLLAAHARGIVHRDVKPANVMVGDDGRVRLGDFGVAALLDDPTVSSSGAVTGSPAYMAPEQATSQGAVPQSDLWSLGATLYFAVEGRPPFDRGGPVPTLTAIVTDEPRPAERAGDLAPVLAALLVKDPAERMGGGELRERLSALASGSPPAPSGRLANDDTVSDALGRGRHPTAVIPTGELRAPVGGAAEPASVGGPARSTRPAASAGPEPGPPPAPPPAPGPVSVRRPPAGGAPTRRRPAAVLAGLIGLVVVALVAVGLLSDRPEGTPGAAGPATTLDGGGGDADPAPATTSRAPEPGPATSGWVRYTDPQTGFAISYPRGWDIRRSGTLTDFRDPDTGAYLRVDHVQPPGPSPEGAWVELEKSFAAENAGYRRIRIEPTTYRGYRAALWEFTYSAGGADLRVANLGFVTPRYGFALYFQTRAADWERMQPLLARFKEAFQAPA